MGNTLLLAAAAGAAGIPPIICTILLIATIIAFIIGLVEALGIRTFSGSRFGTLIVAVVLLVIYVVLC